MRFINFLILFFLPFLKAHTQETINCSQYELTNCVNTHILVDLTTKTRFILDSSRITITAIDSSGKIIWQTDPWKDNKLFEYRFERPVIVYFGFNIPEWTKAKDAIGINYNNTQFGTLERKTGKFTFYGQD
jgi:hypothetical protein